MNKLYFTRVVEKARGLFTSSQRQTDRQAERERQTDRDRQTETETDREIAVVMGVYFSLYSIYCWFLLPVKSIIIAFSPSAAAITGFDGVLTQQR